MTSTQVEILLIAVMVAVGCALPGTYLVLRRMALMSDAISHSILLGIVLAYFWVRDLSSPFLVVAAALTGVLTVTLVELLVNTRRIYNDAAIGLVFPTLFSLGVLLISRHAAHVHLDTDAVLLGELAFAPFNRFEVAGCDLGPLSAWVMGGILFLNLLFITLFYKELKLTSFDAALAAAQGFRPALLHYALMTLVSVTAVGAFDAVGSVLVVAFMVVPPATALLLSDRLSRVLLFAAAFGIASSVSGYWVAHVLDASIAGSMAGMGGVLFLLVYLFAPDRGLIAQARRRAAQRLEFAVQMLVVHLLHHESRPEAETENRIDHLEYHIAWTGAFAREVVRKATAMGLVTECDGRLFLTDSGRVLATEKMAE
jgi:manganese/zinc/iron transport system permease protein